MHHSFVALARKPTARHTLCAYARPCCGKAEVILLVLVVLKRWKRRKAAEPTVYTVLLRTLVRRRAFLVRTSMTW